MRILIGFIIFLATLTQAQGSSTSYTGYWQTSLTNCGSLPVDQANTEDAHYKCQLDESHIEFNNRTYRIDPERFYKIYISLQHDDELAFLMWNGERVDLHSTEDHHIDTGGFGIGQYSFVEWRMQEKFDFNPSCPEQGKKCHFLNFYGLILGKEINVPENATTAQAGYPTQVVYQVYKLKKERSCLVNFATDPSKSREANLAEARRYVDNLKDEDYCNM